MLLICRWLTQPHRNAIIHGEFLLQQPSENEVTQQHDPKQPRTGLGYGRRADGSMNWLPLAVGAAAVVVLVMMFMPSRDTTGPVMRDAQPPGSTTSPGTTPAPQK